MSLDLGLRGHEPAHVARSWRSRLARWSAATAVIGFVALCFVWRVEGGRWERVETPSMGTVAPVGTLLWVRPVDFDTVRPGDFITFRPPGSPSGKTYSHRVLAREADGRLTTKGVLSSPDPWHLTAADVVGKVQMRWWGVGRLVQAAPLLLGGAILAMALTGAVGSRWKLPVLLVVAAAVVSTAIAWYRPLVDAEQLSFAPAPGGGADASYVGTGLLPIRLTAHGGPSVVTRAGEVGTVHVDRTDGGGKLQVTLAPAIPWWWWAILVGACFVPALASDGSRRRRQPRGRQGSTVDHPPRETGGTRIRVGAHPA